MTPETPLLIHRPLLANCLNWFLPEFNRLVASPLGGEFPNYTLPEVQEVIDRTQWMMSVVRNPDPYEIDIKRFVQEELAVIPYVPPLFKQAILLYRRAQAAYIENLLGKTFHLELTARLKEEIDLLDALCDQDWFQGVDSVPLPRLKDYLSIQFIEESSRAEPAPEREYDEKFHILQAPTLFLKDLNYFRKKCEDREVEVAIAFLDIDHFKNFNTKYTEPVVDRNLLPRFMQVLEARVYHHGYAYRQGGDEYLVLLPSLQKPLAVAFLDELRTKVANLKYTGMEERTSVSIGLCIAEPGCPLTDRELLDRASQAKKFAKENGRNCIATFASSRLGPEELQIVNGNSSLGRDATT
jgi:diguanylate cyclase (GGDEF)-like protein